jgi:hypothetical protein
VDAQNLAYALTQVIHNFGAAAVLGGAVAALCMTPLQAQSERALAWLVGTAWAAQIGSGMLFGAISFYYYGRFPEISGIAIVALTVKVISAGLGVLLVAVFLLRAARWTETWRKRVWQALIGLGVIALTAAAFLRWFS